MTRKKTHEEFVAEVKALVGDEYTVLGKYDGNAVRIEIIHNTCGNIYKVAPYTFKSGSRCPKCQAILRGKSRTKTHSKFVEEVVEILGDGYEVIGKYENSRTKIEMYHKLCGYFYDAVPNNILKSKSGCPRCANNQPKTTEEFELEIRERFGGEYRVLGDYVNSKTPIEVVHNTCGSICMANPLGISSGQGVYCTKCRRERLFNTETFRKYVKKETLGDYKLIGKFISSVKEVRILHVSCGNIYDVRASSFIKGTRCPKCQSSKGEIAIMYFLDSNKISYSHQYKLQGCYSERSLRFDFGVFDNTGLTCMIEYDGRQHFEPVDVFGGEDQFLVQQRNDEIKNNHCADNGIPLIRIPYWEFDNIDAILTEKLVPLLEESKRAM